MPMDLQVYLLRVLQEKKITPSRRNPLSCTHLSKKRVGSGMFCQGAKCLQCR
jgi:hypothetical protein